MQRIEAHYVFYYCVSPWQLKSPSAFHYPLSVSFNIRARSEKRSYKRLESVSLRGWESFSSGLPLPELCLPRTELGLLSFLWFNSKHKQTAPWKPKEPQSPQQEESVCHFYLLHTDLRSDPACESVGAESCKSVCMCLRRAPAVSTPCLFIPWAFLVTQTCCVCQLV